MSHAIKHNSLCGGHCRGHLYEHIIWDSFDAPVPRLVYRPVAAELHLPGLWLGTDHGPSHDHDLFVAQWSKHGASTAKHFSRFYAFLGCPLYRKRWHLWGAVIRLADQFVPEGQAIQILFDDTTKKKAGSYLAVILRVVTVTVMAQALPAKNTGRFGV